MTGDEYIDGETEATGTRRFKDYHCAGDPMEVFTMSYPDYQHIPAHPDPHSKEVSFFHFGCHNLGELHILQYHI